MCSYCSAHKKASMHEAWRPAGMAACVSGQGVWPQRLLVGLGRRAGSDGRHAFGLDVGDRGHIVHAVVFFCAVRAGALTAAALVVRGFGHVGALPGHVDRKSTRLNSSHLVISYAVFCLKKK